jgi:hypothetical protein
MKATPQIVVTVTLVCCAALLSASAADGIAARDTSFSAGARLELDAIGPRTLRADAVGPRALETPATTGVPRKLADAATPAIPAGGAARQKPTISSADYERWESLGGGEMSPDGSRLAVSVRRADRTFELRLHDVTAAAAEPRVIESGGSPTFSADSRWLAYSIAYSEAEQEGLREREEPVRNKV